MTVPIVKIQMKERVTMIKRTPSAHPARRARIATTGLSMSALLGMISVFGWNAQVAAQVETAQKIQSAKQAKVAAAIAAGRAAAKPHVRVVVVTVPAPVRTRYVTAQSNSSGNQGSPSKSYGQSNNRVVASGSNTHSSVQVSRPAPVVRTAPVVVYQPVQTSQATSGGSKVKK